jgi:hypothetical protein
MGSDDSGTAEGFVFGIPDDAGDGGSGYLGK